MPPIFSSTFRACAIALSTSRLHARPLLLLLAAQLPASVKAGLGAKLRDGFFGGTIPVCAAAGRLAAALAPAGPAHMQATAIAVSIARNLSEPKNPRLRAAFTESASCIPPHRRHRRANQRPENQNPQKQPPHDERTSPGQRGSQPRLCTTSHPPLAAPVVV
jgi:hypothetical protein